MNYASISTCVATGENAEIREVARTPGAPDPVFNSREYYPGDGDLAWDQRLAFEYGVLLARTTRHGFADLNATVEAQILRLKSKWGERR